MGGMFKPEGVAAIVDAFNRFGMGIDASQMIFFPKVADVGLRKTVVTGFKITASRMFSTCKTIR